MFWRMVKLQSFVKISLKVSQFMKHGPRKGPFCAGKTRREMEAMMIGEIVKFNRWLIEARLGSEHVSITQQENGDLTIINAGINSARGQRKNTSSIGGFVMAGSETSMTSFNPTFNPQCQHVKSRKIMMNPDVCC